MQEKSFFYAKLAPASSRCLLEAPHTSHTSHLTHSPPHLETTVHEQLIVILEPNKPRRLQICLYLNMYECMHGHHVQQTGHQPLWFLTGSSLRTWSRETGSVVSSRVSSLILKLSGKNNLVLTRGPISRFPRRRPHIPSTAIGSVPS